MSNIWWTRSCNPISGCTPVSEACDHCYAARIAATRLQANPRYFGLATKLIWPEGSIIPSPCPPRFIGQIRCHADLLDEPLHWRKPQRVFVCSMSDLFHPQVPLDFMAGQVMQTVIACPQHRFLVLTKRPKRIPPLFSRDFSVQRLPNLWLGVTAENQARFNERWPVLREVWPGHKFISCEPMLGPVDIGDGAGIEWVICGGETGPGARPMDSTWALWLYDQCKAAGIPFFFKHWGMANPQKQDAYTAAELGQHMPAALLLPGETP
jgi:protein gp37